MSDVILYTTEDGKTQIDLRLEDGTVWLSQLQIADLFSATKQNISLHLKNIFEDEELNENSVVKESLTTAADDKNYRTKLYNLDGILAVGYRVRSPRGVEFRRWASTVLKEYLEKGFAMNDERLKNLGGGNYWKELLARIRDIRSSEKVMYRQVLDLYATATDYQPSGEDSLKFFRKPSPHWKNRRKRRAGRKEESMSEMSDIGKLFASKYRTVLPTEAELIAELEHERRVIEQQQNGGDT